MATIVLSVVTLTGATSAVAQPGRQQGAPETFTANANVTGAAGAAAATFTVVIKRYTPDADRTAVEGALKGGGYPAFLKALRQAPDVGYVQHGPNQFAIRYARETRTPKGRTIVLVTEKPMFFLGGAAPDAKPREGYEVALLRMEIDDVGLGNGMMTGAARVKPLPEGGVQVDDYAEQPIKLVTVTRKLS
ncbi:MAG TPA: hypothetical protein VD833_21250 [Vicinamibacterales bacterium]|nr:hypothetical protein [Vicinamibacterales bacterium]